jgi:hypothetical protein
VLVHPLSTSLSALKRMVSASSVCIKILILWLMKNVVVWNVTSCSSCKNRHFIGFYCFHYQGEKNEEARNNIISNYQLKQNMAFFIVTTMKTSNLTLWLMVLRQDFILAAKKLCWFLNTCVCTDWNLPSTEDRTSLMWKVQGLHGFESMSSCVSPFANHFTHDHPMIRG